jgi:1-deoxy-D-xylulose-5-phosphate synthase
MLKYKLLDSVNYPADLKKLSIEQLPLVCSEIREYIIDTLSNVGGHFASNLGAVELTVAIHYVFNTPVDRLIWDVGHQTYPHKILTGRKHLLHTVRKFDGISGFPKREESEYDLYNTGHAGTSISQLLGEAVSRDLSEKTYNCMAVIGDASIASGMALEALNHGGEIKPNCLVILNDNLMSISKNIGSISNYLNYIITSHFYSNYKRFYYNIIKWLPLIGPALVSFSKKIEKSFKVFLTPGGLFEDLGFTYYGPIDGHDIFKLIEILEKIKSQEGPILLHVLTQKGKGYSPAESDPIKFHGVTPFLKESGQMKQDTKVGYSKLIGECLIRFTAQNSNIAAITPAMIEGSGLKSYSEKYPKNLFDVGIAEQHSVTFASGLLAGGVIPFMCIYSTFMTRALDQMIHDVSLMNLPVRFVIDRSGIVGADGETHQGLFDLGFLCAMPNMSIYVPSSAQDLINSMYMLKDYNEGPIAIRFPKASEEPSQFSFEKVELIPVGKSRLALKGKDFTILSVGTFLDLSFQIAHELQKSGIELEIIDLAWIRPLDVEFLNLHIASTKRFFILDESYLDSGVTGYILTRLSPSNLSKYFKTYALPPEIIPHGERKEILSKYNLTMEYISKEILTLDS